MANAWVEFVKKWSKDNNETYSCSVSLPACREAYQKTKPPKKAKKLTQKQEREAMGAEDVSSTAQRTEATASLSRKKASINKGKTIIKAKQGKRAVEKQLVETVGMMGEDRNVAVPKGDVVAVRPRGRPKKYATTEEAKEAKATKTVEAKKKRQALKKEVKAQKKAKPLENIQMVLEDTPSQPIVPVVSVQPPAPAPLSKEEKKRLKLERQRQILAEADARMRRDFPNTNAVADNPDLVRRIGEYVSKDKPNAYEFDWDYIRKHFSDRGYGDDDDLARVMKLLEKGKYVGKSFDGDYMASAIMNWRRGERPILIKEEIYNVDVPDEYFIETGGQIEENLTGEWLDDVWKKMEKEKLIKYREVYVPEIAKLQKEASGSGRSGGKSPCMNGKELKGSKCVKIGGAVEVSNPEINNDWFRNYAQRLNQPLINYKGLADSIAHPNISQVRDLVGKINGLIG